MLRNCPSFSTNDLCDCAVSLNVLTAVVCILSVIFSGILTASNGHEISCDKQNTHIPALQPKLTL